MDFKFDWDPKKAALNQKKHGINFKQAITIWDDPKFLDIYDRVHSKTEDRFIRVGLSDAGAIVVIYTKRGNQYRIISARKASRKERRLYHETQRKN